MNQPSSEPAPVAPVAPSPTPDRRVAALRLVAVLLSVAACWAARELLVPILVALFVGLVANPGVTWLRRLRVPRWIGGILVVFGGVAIALTLASQLVTPARNWVQKAPQELREVAPKLRVLVRRVDEANRAAASIVSAAGAGTTPSARAVVEANALARVPSPPSLWGLIRAAPAMLIWFGAVILLGYFFVVFGVDLQYRVIAQLSGQRRRPQSDEIVRIVERELSRYVMTITVINTGLALVLALVFWQLGMEPGDALLWGVIGGLLNFAPYVGPVIGVVALLLVGLVGFDAPVQMLLPAACYLALQLLESEVVTPWLLGRRWRLSPLVVLLWLLFCGWLWGVPGVLLSVPVMVCFKIVAERVESLQGWAKAIE